MNFAQISHIAYDIFRLAALLTVGVLGYCLVRHRVHDRLPSWAAALLYGLLFAAIGAVCSLGGVILPTGIRVDLVVVDLVIATIFAGPAAGFVAMILLAALRTAAGDDYLAATTLMLGITFAISAADRVYLDRRGAEPGWRNLFALSLVVGVGVIATNVVGGPSDLTIGIAAVLGPTWLALMVATVLFVAGVIRVVDRNHLLRVSLQERESELRAIMDNAPIAMFLKDRDGRFQLVNRCFREWYQRDSAQIYGRADLGVIPQSHADYIRQTDAEVVLDGRTADYEHSTWYAQPGIEDVHVTKVPVRDSEGKITGIAGFVLDITASKRAERALRENQALLIESQRIGKVGYVLNDVLTGRLYWSETAAELHGISQREFVTFDETLRFFHPDDRARVLETHNAAHAQKRDFEIQARVVHGDGSIHWQQFIAHPRFDDSGRLTSYLGFIRDITESRNAEEALRQSEKRFRALINNSNDMLIVVDIAGAIVYRSPAASEILGYSAEEMIGRRLVDRVHPEDSLALSEAFRMIGAAPGRQTTGRSRVLRSDGLWRQIAWSARNAIDVSGIAGIVINSRDVTEALNVEEQLLQAQKMEAVGRLAGGIAHDFNNVLGAIRGFAGFLQQDLSAETPQHRFADRIVDACERARQLVQQLLAFSRQDTIERVRTDVARLVVETQELLRVAIPSSTQLNVVGEMVGMIADVSPAQIGQILFNLCLNGNDALGGQPGSITIEVARVVAGDPDYDEVGAGSHMSEIDRAQSVARLTSGTLDRAQSYARLRVSDTGSGMDASVLKRVFDPFFTTKERGRGTGLGLSVVHGIVVGYGGACDVSSRIGHGSVFTIYLPLVSSGVADHGAEESAPGLGGHERLLVVDDEVDISDMLTIGLDRLGYEVIAVNDPEEAVSVFAEDPEMWDVVICDQVMPRLNGLGVLKRLRAIRPLIRFVLCTGFSEGITEEVAAAEGIDALIAKPVPVDILAATIRRLNDQAPPQSTSDVPPVAAD